MEIPFDDSLDGSNALECFFQMPVQTRAIKAAKVWVQRKSFRQYSSAASSSASSTTSGQIQNTANASTGTNTDAAHLHLDGDGITNTGLTTPGGHAHIYIGQHDHNVPAQSVTTTLTPGIFETAAAGTMSLFVADDGVTYGSAITTGATSMTGQVLTPSLTKSAGDKRIKITATGLMRVQVLLILDLRVAVLT